VQHGVRALRAGRARWLLTGAAESPLDRSEPGASGSEDGAVALVVERAEEVEARGGRSHGRVQVRSFLLPPPVAESARGREQAERLLAAAFTALGLAGRRPQVWLIGGDDAVTGTVEAALGEGAVRATAGAGCLGPAVQVAALLRDAFVEQLVIGVAAQGNVSVAHVVPSHR
jgi:3-oxoacyl-[acyl-carrier-protein] synthase II